MALPVYPAILIAVFIAIVICTFSRKRKARFEKYGRIPCEGDKKKG